MRPAHIIEIITPKKFVLNGLWFGPKKPKQVIVWVHGLSGSAFSTPHLVAKLVDAETAMVTFNNRGFERVAEVKRRVGGKMKLTRAGAAHEVFTDCIDDIQGAINFARRAGVKNIYLAGHSTGCQKSIYWAAKNKGGRGIKGIVLLAPISDWSAEMKLQGKKQIARATAVARALVRQKKAHQLLPEGVWHEVVDAQRFLSLYTPESIEEIFSYAQLGKDPRILKLVHTPVLVFLAEKDEFADRPAKKIAAWFDTNIRAPHQVVIVPRVGHGFKGGEKIVAAAVRDFVRLKL